MDLSGRVVARVRIARAAEAQIPAEVETDKALQDDIRAGLEDLPGCGTLAVSDVGTSANCRYMHIFVDGMRGDPTEAASSISAKWPGARLRHDPSPLYPDESRWFIAVPRSVSQWRQVTPCTQVVFWTALALAVLSCAVLFVSARGAADPWTAPMAATRSMWASLRLRAPQPVGAPPPPSHDGLL